MQGHGSYITFLRSCQNFPFSSVDGNPKNTQTSAIPCGEHAWRLVSDLSSISKGNDAAQKEFIFFWQRVFKLAAQECYI